MPRAGLLLAMVLAACTARRAEERPPLRFATFNIEDFPHSEAQIDGAFRELAALRADVVALEELVDPVRFAVEAHIRLGDRWQMRHSGQLAGARRYPRLRTAVLWDSERFDVGRVQGWDETIEAGGLQPVLDVELRPRDGRPTLRVLVVHLRCCSDGRPGRAREHAALRALLARPELRGARVLVAGDFNATDEADRADLAELSRASGLVWATAGLPCTAFWHRPGDCPTSRLDHILSFRAPVAVRAGGACTDGCETRDLCPRYVREVSDHCPVVIDLPDEELARL